MKLSDFLCNHIKAFFGLAGMGGILLLVNGLYGKEQEPVLYGLGICLFFYICYLIWCYYREKRIKEQLQILRANPIEETELLPRPRNSEEREYQEIMRQLRDDLRRVEQEKQDTLSRTMDYYALWTHQIKTPIAAMKLLVEKQTDPVLRNSQEQELMRIEQYAQMALNYHRLMDKEDDYLLKRQDLYPIVKEALKKFSVTFIEKRLSLEFAEFHEQVLTDAKWMGFIIEQLLSNSLKYTKSGTVTIEVSTLDSDVLLQIRDTGMGIRSEDLPRIFDRGYTGYNGHMDRKSTGIGLYLCKMAADNIGVELELQSTLGSGTTVALRIPK